MTCNNCTWFVEETEELLNFQHSQAVENQRGFCLLKDLFTMQEPDDPACSDFNFDGDEKCKN